MQTPEQRIAQALRGAGYGYMIAGRSAGDNEWVTATCSRTYGYHTHRVRLSDLLVMIHDTQPFEREHDAIRHVETQGAREGALR